MEKEKKKKERKRRKNERKRQWGGREGYTKEKKVQDGEE